MEQRALGRTGLAVGVIGFGTGYLYRMAEPAIVDLVREAIDFSVNYFDNWIPNPEARRALGIAFRGNRDRVFLAGHLGVHMRGDQSDVTRDPAEAQVYFDEMLAEIGVDHVDVLMLHNVDRAEDYDRIVGGGGLLACARRLQAQGKARFIGLSGHEPGPAIRATEAGLVDVVMAPVGIAWQPAGVAEACASHGIGLVGMKPFWGGELLQKPYSDLVTPVIALSYALSQPAVATVVPGFRNREELHASLRYLAAPADERDFRRAKAAHGTNTTGTCVYCGHCQPCPAGIDIGEVLSILRSAQRGSPYARDRLGGVKVMPAECTACGECVSRCPQRVAIPAEMAEAATVFAAWQTCQPRRGG